MDFLSITLGRVFFAIVAALTLAWVITLNGCTTVPAQEQKSCSQLVQETARATEGEGYQFLQSAPEAVGELAVFISGPAARLFYLTPSSEVAEYLATKGWNRAGECHSSSGQPMLLLRRDVTLPPTPMTPT